MKNIFLILCFMFILRTPNAKTLNPNFNYLNQNNNKPNEDNKYTIGLNLCQFLITYGLSLSLRSFKEQYFLPLHFNGIIKLNSHFSFYGGLIYRRDTFGTFSNYNEFICLSGLRYSPYTANKFSGLYFAARIGYGYARGNFTKYIDDSKYKNQEYIFHRKKKVFMNLKENYINAMN